VVRSLVDGLAMTARTDYGARRPKINLPSFNGESDPLHWVNKCATYFRAWGLQSTRGS
jgi:hypothetical protein